MIPLKLNYNYKDIFLAPKIALSGKKIFMLIKGNLFGYILYFICSTISILTTGMNIEDTISKYGLYPYLFGHQAEWYSWIIYFFGVAIWLFTILVTLTGVSRILLKQLKGDDFYSGKDAWEFIYKYWQAVVLAPISILSIIISFFLLSFIFASVGKIPLIGTITFPLLYIFYFFGSIFTILSILVFFSSLLYVPSIVGIYEEDTMGSVFQTYAIFFSQTSRVFLYNILLGALLVISVELFSWICFSSMGLISYIFGDKFFMGNQFSVLNSFSISIVFPTEILDTLIFFKTYIFEKLHIDFNISLFFDTLFKDTELKNLSIIETISSVILSIIYFVIGLSIFSYGLSILSVGQSLMFVIFKKLSDHDDIISRSDGDFESDSLIIQNNFDSNFMNPSNLILDEEE